MSTAHLTTPLTALGYVFSESTLTHPNLCAAPGAAWWSPLPEWCSIEFSGADAKAFLQSQLTNDVNALSPCQTQWQGWCSAKGRLQATFGLLCVSPERYLALIHRSLAEAAVKRLKMFVLRSKVVISLQKDPIFGGVGFVPDLGSIPIWRFADGRFALACPVEQTESILQSFGEATPVDPSAWTGHAVKSGIPFVTLATFEHFVPQMMGWDTIGVNFKKGCYPGQEVVARSHYLGQSKRGLWRVELAGCSVTAGDELTLAGDRSFEIVNCVAVNGTVHALAVGPITLDPAPAEAIIAGTTVSARFQKL